MRTTLAIVQNPSSLPFRTVLELFLHALLVIIVIVGGCGYAWQSQMWSTICAWTTVPVREDFVVSPSASVAVEDADDSQSAEGVESHSGTGMQRVLVQKWWWVYLGWNLPAGPLPIISSWLMISRVVGWEVATHRRFLIALAAGLLGTALVGLPPVARYLGRGSQAQLLFLPTISCSVVVCYLGEKLSGFKGFAKNMLGVLVCWCALLFPFFVLSAGSKIVALEDDFTKILLAILFWPIYRESISVVLRWVLREVCTVAAGGPDAPSSNDKKQDTVYMFYFGFFMFSSLVSRFLLISMEDESSFLVTVFMTAFQEMVTRLSYDYRELLCARYVFRMTEEEVEKEYMCSRHRRFRAVVLLADMHSEYVAILATPATLLVFSKIRYLKNFGYQGDAPAIAASDVSTLAWHSAIQLLVEFAGDFLCCGMEEKVYMLPLRDTWRNLNSRSRGFNLGVFLWGLMCYIFFASGFHVNEPSEVCVSTWGPGFVETRYVCEPECLKGINYSVFETECSSL